MTKESSPRVFSIPPGAPFLKTLAESLLQGRLVPGFAFEGDPAALSDVTIFVPTRRAARALRSVFAECLGGRSVILPSIRPLGEIDEVDASFEAAPEDALALAPPVSAVDRVLMLAPLVRAWKRRLPAHIAQMFSEEIVVPASAADSIWLARDLAALIDEVETEGADWKRLGDLVGGDLAGWWQVTLDFLDIVTEHWPSALKERDRSNPAANRDALIRAEAARLSRNPPPGPVVAAGSTGSIPATAELLSVVARLPKGAVVLPGFDPGLDDASWAALTAARPEPQVCGHPQFGLARLLGHLGVGRADVPEIGTQAPSMDLRRTVLSEAMRPATTTNEWLRLRAQIGDSNLSAALHGISLVEAANEHEESVAAAIALRRAVETSGRRAAFVTPDRELARRVSSELLRFGIHADDSGGTPLVRTATAQLMSLMLDAALRPGAPVPIATLIKHPLLRLGLPRAHVRRAAEIIELVVLRGAASRPDVHALDQLFARRLASISGGPRKPFWFSRLVSSELATCRDVLRRLADALAPLKHLQGTAGIDVSEATVITVTALEKLGRDEANDLQHLYAGDAGQTLAETLRTIAGSAARLSVPGSEWPDVLAALVAPSIVKPSPRGDSRVSIWGTLEARLQSVDTLVVGGLNEGSWPRRADADRFMSRMMKGNLELQPPERRIGLAAHDFVMALGTADIVLTRAARSGNAPATPSRWLQRLTTFIGAEQTLAMRARGGELLTLARALDKPDRTFGFRRPEPKPPLAARPKTFSVTEIETLRRDPYAIYAKRILGLLPLDPMVRDPGAAERGTLFHDVLHRFTQSCPDPLSADAPRKLIESALAAFRDTALPSDVEAVWWPRFLALSKNPDGLLAWERGRAAAVKVRHAEARAEPIKVGGTGVTLFGYADRIDILYGGMGSILDYKTGSTPSKAQAHTLIAPQLALEGALLARGAFASIGKAVPSELSYVRLRANGMVDEESILELPRRPPKSAPQLSEEAWRRLEELLTAYRDPLRGYTSRALPFREGDTDGDYDHLARVLEWSAGGDHDEMLPE